MKEFFKKLATKLVLALVKGYQKKTVHEVRENLARRYEALAGALGSGARGIFLGLVVTGVVAGGFLLVPLAAAIGVVVLSSGDGAISISGLAVAFWILLITGLLYILVPLGLCWHFTSEEKMRRSLKTDEVTRRLRRD